MPVSALIVTFPDGADASRALASRLSDDPRITLGPREGARQVLVVETASPAEDQTFFDELQRGSGVSLELVCSDFSDAEADALTLPPNARRLRTLDDGGATRAPEDVLIEGE